MNGLINEGIQTEFSFHDRFQSIWREGTSGFSVRILEWKSGLEISCKIEVLSDFQETFTSTAEKKNAAIKPVSQLKESIANGNRFFILKDQKDKEDSIKPINQTCCYFIFRGYIFGSEIPSETSTVFHGRLGKIIDVITNSPSFTKNSTEWASRNMRISFASQLIGAE